MGRPNKNTSDKKSSQKATRVTKQRCLSEYFKAVSNANMNPVITTQNSVRNVKQNEGKKETALNNSVFQIMGKNKAKTHVAEVFMSLPEDPAEGTSQGAQATENPTPTRASSRTLTRGYTPTGIMPSLTPETRSTGQGLIDDNYEQVVADERHSTGQTRQW